RAAQVRAAGKTNAAAFGEFPELVFPIRARDHLADALGKSDRAYLQPVRGERIGLGDDGEAQLGRVDLEFLRDLVELHFLAEARLRRAVPTLGAARRLVGEGSAGVELVARDVIGHRLEHARVESARRTVAAIG